MAHAASQADEYLVGRGAYLLQKQVTEKVTREWRLFSECNVLEPRYRSVNDKSPMHSITGERGTLHRVAAYRFILHLPSEKQAMEMTEYGKCGKP